MPPLVGTAINAHPLGVTFVATRLPLRGRAVLVVLVLSGFGLGLCGCASSQRMGIESAPAGAEIYLDGVLVGHTPAQVRLARDRPHKVFLKLEGYRPELVVVERHTPSDRIDFLTPADVRVRLVPEASGIDRDLDIRVEPEAP